MDKKRVAQWIAALGVGTLFLIALMGAFVPRASTVCGTVQSVSYKPSLLSSDYFVTIDNTMYPIIDDAFDHTADTAIAGTLRARIGSNVCVKVMDGKILEAEDGGE